MGGEAEVGGWGWEGEVEVWVFVRWRDFSSDSRSRILDWRLSLSSASV